MKYLLWPPFAIVMVVFALCFGAARFILLTLWHFRKITAREAYTLDGTYLFEDWSWERLFKEILVCPWGKDNEEDDDKEEKE